MSLIPVIVLMALFFGVIYLCDKGFTRIFRGKVQHQSGKALRQNKRYASFGLILSILGLASMFAYTAQGWIMLAAGGGILLVGVGMIVFYMTFGVFYDEEGFVLTTFGKKSTTYTYRQIKGQMLFSASGNTVVELHMEDGRTVHLAETILGMGEFMDHAFDQWCRQTGKQPESCDFHDPENSWWFPKMEG